MKPPFEQVVEIHGATVLRVCRAVLGPRPESEDAWSETFLAALRAYPALPSDANVQAWLVTIAHRKALDAVRAAGRRAVPVADVPERHSTIGLVRDRDDALWRALAALPERQRLTVAYHHVAGLSFREVAGILGGTPEAARRASSDGIRALRSALGGNRRTPIVPPPPTAKGTP